MVQLNEAAARKGDAPLATMAFSRSFSWGLQVFLRSFKIQLYVERSTLSQFLLWNNGPPSNLPPCEEARRYSVEVAPEAMGAFGLITN